MVPAHKAVGDAAVQVRCAAPYSAALRCAAPCTSGLCPTLVAVPHPRCPAAPNVCLPCMTVGQLSAPLNAQAAIREAELLLEEVQALRL